jgi:hypothetical protein
MQLVRSDAEIIISVSLDELQLLSASVGEALESVEEWEFSTRLGVGPEDATALQAAINAILGKVSSPR